VKGFEDREEVCDGLSAPLTNVRATRFHKPVAEPDNLQAVEKALAVTISGGQPRQTDLHVEVRRRSPLTHSDSCSAPSRGSTGLAGVSTRPAGLFHPWATTSCRMAAPLTLTGVSMVLRGHALATAKAPAAHVTLCVQVVEEWVSEDEFEASVTPGGVTTPGDSMSLGLTPTDTPQTTPPPKPKPPKKLAEGIEGPNQFDVDDPVAALEAALG